MEPGPQPQTEYLLFSDNPLTETGPLDDVESAKAAAELARGYLRNICEILEDADPSLSPITKLMHIHVIGVAFHQQLCDGIVKRLESAASVGESAEPVRRLPRVSLTPPKSAPPKKAMPTRSSESEAVPPKAMAMLTDLSEAVLPKAMPTGSSGSGSEHEWTF